MQKLNVRITRFLAQCGVLFFTGSPVGEAGVARENPQEIHSEIAQEFLKDVCSKSPGKEFTDAWLRHELKHWDVYEAAYYQSDSSRKERNELAAAMGDRRDEVCKYARTFLLIAPAVIDVISPKVRMLTGFQPSLPLYFVAALQWTDGRGFNFHGGRAYVFNARHDTYARTTGMVATMIHELIHSAFAKRKDQGKALEQVMPPTPAALFSEGIAVYGTQLMLPEIGDGATGLKAEELVAAEKMQSAAARELLRLWNNEAEGPDHEKLFSGGWKGTEQPRKMGYFLGLKVFRHLEKEMGIMATMRITYTDFKGKARAILEKIAERT